MQGLTVDEPPIRSRPYSTAACCEKCVFGRGSHSRDCVLIGKKIGRWEIIADAGKHYGRTGYYLCRCQCGTWRVVSNQHLRTEVTQSCGCIRGSRSGRRKSPEYRSWAMMVQRCTNQNHPDARIYSGRGISVCARWRSYDLFLEDMGVRPPRTSLDRYPNNDGNYEPGNCRWATPKQQRDNQRKMCFRSDASKERCKIIEVIKLHNRSLPSFDPDSESALIAKISLHYFTQL